MTSDGQAGRAIWQFANFVKRINKSRSGKNNLAQAQESVICFLVLLPEGEKVCQKDIAEKFDLRPATVTAIVDGLEEKGLIRRQISEDDSRVKYVIPTETAVQAKPQIIEGINQFESLLTKGITEQEMETFFHVANCIMENLKL